MRTLHSHVCTVCGVQFSSVDRDRSTCSASCRGKRGRSAPTKSLCKCGRPANRRGHCDECAVGVYTAMKKRHYSRHRDDILRRRRERYRRDAAVRKQIAAAATARRFNGLRDERMKLDNFECTECGARDKLVVHHQIRRENRNQRDAQSTIDDLITLCRACHINVHRQLGDLQAPSTYMARQ